MGKGAGHKARQPGSDPGTHMVEGENQLPPTVF